MRVISLFSFALAAILWSSAPLSALDLIPFGSVWDYMHPLDGVDPAVADADFNTTWMAPDLTAAGYNGPAFSASGAGLLGYGSIDFQAITTNIGTPASGNRYTAYFRHEFTLATGTTGPVGFETLMDDGGVIYLDGVEVDRINFSGADTYLQPTDAVGSESSTTTRSFPSLAAGSHVLAVSLHNQSTTSSDLGFDLRLFTSPLSFGDLAPPAGTGFSEPAAGSTSYVAAGTELGFIGGSGPGVTDIAGNQAYLMNNSAMTLSTDLVDLRNHTGVSVSIDVRTWEDSGGSDFETNDFIRVYAEASEDGLTFDQIDILPQIIGGSGTGDPADQLKALDLGGEFGPFTNFSTMIPDNYNTLRVVISASNNSGSERFVFDNIHVGGTLIPEPSAGILGLLGFAALGLWHRRRPAG